MHNLCKGRGQLCSCARSFVLPFRAQNWLFFDVLKPWRQLKSQKKLLVVSLNCHFLEFLAVSTDRWFINAGPD